MSTSSLLQSISAFLRNSAVDHALIGACALQAYGYVRTTRDIDFVARHRDQAKIVGFAESLGFATVHASEAYSNHVHPLDELRVDFMYVDDVTGERLFRSATTTSVFGASPVPVVAPEHLIAMKLFAARSQPDRRLKDLADVKEVIRRTDVSRSIVESLAAKYGLEKWIGELYEADTRGS